MKTPSNPPITIEDLCMAHRYLYYVKARPIITDREYDLLENVALKCLAHDSPMNRPGSSLEVSYTPEQKQLAMKLLNQ